MEAGAITTPSTRRTLAARGPGAHVAARRCGRGPLRVRRASPLYGLRMRSPAPVPRDRVLRERIAGTRGSRSARRSEIVQRVNARDEGDAVARSWAMELIEKNGSTRTRGLRSFRRRFDDEQALRALLRGTAEREGHGAAHLGLRRSRAAPTTSGCISRRCASRVASRWRIAAAPSSAPISRSRT